MNKIKVRIIGDNHIILRRLYSRNINVYDIQYNGNSNVYTIDYNDLDRVPFDKEVISFLGIKGFLVLILSNKHFLISLLISILIMLGASNLIVSVEVIHNNKEIRTIVLEELYENGIHPFTFKKNFNDLQTIKKNIYDKYPKAIEWLEIMNSGMKYIVRVEERIITKENNKPLYCDIVSKKDATILSSKVKSGQEAVGYNDFVKKGSILVDGKIKFNESIKSYVCADAIIYGNTWYTVNVSVPFVHEEKKYTGRTSSNISFLYGSKRTPVLKVHFNNYDIEKSEFLNIGNLSIWKEKNLEYKLEKKKYTYEEAYEQALLLGRDKIKTNLPSNATILDEKVLQTNTYDSIIEMNLFYSVKEIISEQIEKEIVEEEGKADVITR